MFAGWRGAAMSKWEADKAERNRRSIARLTKSLPCIFPSAVLSRALGRPFVPPTLRLAIDSYWNAIHFAPIAWRGRYAAVDHLADGPGGSGIVATMACRPHSERHQRPIGNGLTRRVQDFVVYTGNWFIAAPVRAISEHIRGGVFGRVPRLTAVFRYFGFGANTRHGQSCSSIGACQTCWLSIETPTPQNAQPKRAIGAPHAIRRALNCWTWVRSLTHWPEAVIHSPALTAAAYPTTVTMAR